MIAEDRRAFEHPYIKGWCGRRWRNIFLSEAVHGVGALDAAPQKGLLRKEEHSKEIEAFDIPFFNITAATSIMRLPFSQIQGFMVLNRRGGSNDMMITENEAKLSVPMATNLATVDAHHWDLSFHALPRIMRLASNNLDHPFPKEAAITAMIKPGAELGIID